MLTPSCHARRIAKPFNLWFGSRTTSYVLLQGKSGENPALTRNREAANAAESDYLN